MTPASQILLLTLLGVSFGPFKRPLRRRRGWQFLPALAALILIAVWYLCPESSLPKPFGRLSWQIKTQNLWSLPHHAVNIDSTAQTVSVQKGNRTIWSTLPHQAFVGASYGKLLIKEHRGSFSIKYRNIEPCADQTLDNVEQIGDKVILSGKLICPDKIDRQWKIALSENEQGDLTVNLETDAQLQRIFWRVASAPQEHIFGTGEQFTFFDLKNHLIPIWVSEQGIGRGLQPLTFILNWFADGSGGSPVTTYLSSAQFVTSENRAFHRHGSRYGEFDFTDSKQIVFDYWDHSAKTTVVAAETPKELIRRSSVYSGRMRALPDWIHRGAILGLQGGTEKVRRVLHDLNVLQTPISGIWLQDWVGQRRTSIGKQLWWNWDLDRIRYPEWEKLRQDLNAQNIRILGYINPFLVELPNEIQHERRLIDEARQKDLLVKDRDGKVLEFQNTSFSAEMVDLSKPEARLWMKSVIKAQLANNGFYGWMADFGEALPMEAHLSQSDPQDFHNIYPEIWAQVNREAIDELPDSANYVFFSRSGFSNSPRFSTLFWAGDQMVTWDEFDGLKTALTSLLSSGLSGATFNHTDIGGYTAFKLPVFSHVRTEELLIRWMELNAFTAVFRTHEGNQPENNLQIYSTSTLQDAFTKNAKLFQSLFSYRKKLIAEAAANGWPLVRPMWFEFPDEVAVISNDQQFMLGSDILVAPVLDPGRSSVDVFFPKGTWRHLITGDELKIEASKWMKVSAPLGQPAAFSRGERQR